MIQYGGRGYIQRNNHTLPYTEKVNWKLETGNWKLLS